MTCPRWRCRISADSVDVPLRRNRDYLLLWSGQLVSNAGTSASSVAFPLLILALTGSATQAGFVAAVEQLPYPILSLPAGALVDRWDRKRAMVLCELGRAAALGSIPVLLWTGHLAMAWLYAAALVEGTLFVFFTLALTACLPMVVGPGQLGEAAAQNYAAGSVAALIGPILGGGLYQLRRLLPFLADATSYAVSLTSLLFIRVRFQETRIATARDLRQEIREGLAWLWDHAVIRAMAFLAMGYWVAYAGMPLILIVLARRNMHASPAAIGLLLGVGAAGGIVGSLLAPAIGRRLRFGRAMIGYVWLMTILWGACAAAPDLPILAVLVTVLFLVTPTGDVLQFSYRLALIPDSLQGRVNSVFRLIGWSGRPVGLALAGALAQRLGPDAALLATAAGGIVLALATTLSRSVRTAR